MSGLDTQARKQKVISVFDEVAGQQEEFQRAHLAQLDSLQTEKGLWMGVEVRVTLGRVPQCSISY